MSEPERFRAWIDGFGFWGRIIFVLLVTFQVVVAIIPGEPFEIAAGYVFGGIEGALLCLAGIFLGSVIIFAAVRKFGVKLVEVFFSREKINSLKFLNTQKKTNALVFIIMMIPGTPKDLLSYFAGLTSIKLSSWLWISVVARIPSVATSTVGGGLLGSEKYIFAIIVFAATALISVLGLILYNRFTKKNSEQ
jgi:uncharacterized membrane protein YdjX (TVP38/TMEM64 family)